jgi:hypothetical protein
MEHTPTPWKVYNSTDVFTDLGQANRQGIHADKTTAWHIADCSVGKTLVDGDLVELSFKEAQANARRIVACVNACEGVETENLERGIIKQMGEEWNENHPAELERLRQQNAALVDALTRIRDHMDMDGYEAGAWKALALEMADVARAAIAEAEK